MEEILTVRYGVIQGDSGNTTVVRGFVEDNRGDSVLSKYPAAQYEYRAAFPDMA